LGHYQKLFAPLVSQASCGPGSRYEKVVILNVFKTGINAVSFLPVLSCVFSVFNSPLATPTHGLLGLSGSLRLRFTSENASFIALYNCATTHGHTSLSC